MNGSFTIRPKVMFGESLSSFLYKVCHRNDADFMSLIKGIMKGNLTRNNINKIDITPQKYINIHKLACLLKLEQKEILKLTHFFVLNKFYDEKNVLHSGNFRTHWIEKKYRRFCPICINEYNYFKWNWQIHEFKICIEHKVPITSICSSCQKPQPYIGDHLLTFNCIHCGEFLKQDEDLSFNHEKIDIASQYQVFIDWELLSDPEIIFTEINGFPIEDSNAIKYAFTETSYQDKLPNDRSYRALINLQRNKKHNNNLKLSPIKLLKMLRRRKNSVFDFAKVEVTDEFLKKVLGEIKINTLGPCLAPWCNSYGTNHEVSRIPYQYFNILRSRISYCKKCHMKYGYSKADRSWVLMEEKFVSTIDMIVKLISEGYSIGEAVQRIRSTKYNISRTIGYIASRRMISISNMLPAVPLNTDEVLIIIRDIAQQATNLERMLNIAIKKYNMEPISFFYYYYLEKIQNYLFNEHRKNREKYKSSTKQKWLSKIDSAVIEIENRGERISLERISKTIGCSDTIFKRYKLLGYIKELRKDQRNRLLEDRENRLRIKAEECLSKYLNFHQEIFEIEFYKELGISKSTVFKNHPDLFEFLNETFERIKIAYNENEVKNKILNIESTIDNLRAEGVALTYKNISEKAGYNVCLLRLYPEIKNRINELRI